MPLNVFNQTSTANVTVDEIESITDPVGVLGVNGTGISTAANPFPEQLIIAGSAVSSINQIPVIEGYENFKTYTFQNLAADTIVNFGLNEVNTIGFTAKKVLIRNNSGQPIRVGWLGSKSTGTKVSQNIDSIEVSNTVKTKINCGSTTGLTVGDTVHIRGMLGNCKDALNRSWVIESLDATSFVVPTSAYLTGTADSGAWYSGTGYSVVYAHIHGGSNDGFYVESTSIQNDYWQLPISPIVELCIYNIGSSNTANTPGTCDIYFLG